MIETFSACSQVRAVVKSSTVTVQPCAGNIGSVYRGWVPQPPNTVVRAAIPIPSTARLLRRGWCG